MSNDQTLSVFDDMSSEDLSSLLADLDELMADSAIQEIIDGLESEGSYSLEEKKKRWTWKLIYSFFFFILGSSQAKVWGIKVRSNGLEHSFRSQFSHGDGLEIGDVILGLPLCIGSLSLLCQHEKLYIQTRELWGSYWLFDNAANTYYRIGLPLLTSDRVDLRHRSGGVEWDVMIYPM